MSSFFRDNLIQAEAPQYTMRTVVVVTMPAQSGHAADLIEILDNVAVKDFGTKRPDQSARCRRSGSACPAGYGRDAVPGSPVLPYLADELRAVVEPQALRIASRLDQLVERLNDAGGRQAGVDLDPR